MFLKKKKNKSKDIKLFITIKLIQCVSVSSTCKVSDSCIKDMGLDLHLHQKLIGVLV